MNELKRQILGDAVCLAVVLRKLHKQPELVMHEFEKAEIIKKELSHWAFGISKLVQQVFRDYKRSKGRWNRD